MDNSEYISLAERNEEENIGERSLDDFSQSVQMRDQNNNYYDEENADESNSNLLSRSRPSNYLRNEYERESNNRNSSENEDPPSQNQRANVNHDLAQEETASQNRNPVQDDEREEEGEEEEGEEEDEDEEDEDEEEDEQVDQNQNYQSNQTERNNNVERAERIRRMRMMYRGPTRFGPNICKDKPISFYEKDSNPWHKALNQIPQSSYPDIIIRWNPRTSSWRKFNIESLPRRSNYSSELNDLIFENLTQTKYYNHHFVSMCTIMLWIIFFLVYYSIGVASIVLFVKNDDIFSWLFPGFMVSVIIMIFFTICCLVRWDDKLKIKRHIAYEKICKEMNDEHLNERDIHAWVGPYATYIRLRFEAGILHEIIQNLRSQGEISPEVGEEEDEEISDSSYTYLEGDATPVYIGAPKNQLLEIEEKFMKIKSKSEFPSHSEDLSEGVMIGVPLNPFTSPLKPTLHYKVKSYIPLFNKKSKLSGNSIKDVPVSFSSNNSSCKKLNPKKFDLKLSRNQINKKNASEIILNSDREFKKSLENSSLKNLSKKHKSVSIIKKKNLNKKNEGGIVNENQNEKKKNKEDYKGEDKKDNKENEESKKDEEKCKKENDENNKENEKSKKDNEENNRNNFEDHEHKSKEQKKHQNNDKKIEKNKNPNENFIDKEESKKNEDKRENDEESIQEISENSLDNKNDMDSSFSNNNQGLIL